ncbi:DUF4878 domain-containing protein [Ignatzschineria rhizosphaerae]|uniref:DUF4878 domain-containing protein n=1 Tax=Ignatzschineria rhizosphaerae TaxID=2923279 RepID=A0ABY3X349_9GAMM|nr:DUF4878 domain-containing protein [Ignatzschineria rhizosphaerae]UNM97274.1 DUF4878 domain-containing protein [Ignatzschineria rhizosphaerae]
MKQLKMFFAVMFFVVVAVACGGGADEPEAVAKEFITVFEKGDSKRLLDIIYLDEKDNTPEAKAMIEGKLSMMVGMAQEEMKSKGGIKDVKVDSVEYNSDKTKASVYLIVTYKDGEVSGPDEVGTVKTKDGWKVEL